MYDKMAISAYILKIVENDPFLRLQMIAKERFRPRTGIKYLVVGALLLVFQHIALPPLCHPSALKLVTALSQIIYICKVELFFNMCQLHYHPFAMFPLVSASTQARFSKP